jgi:hypothetical protein
MSAATNRRTVLRVLGAAPAATALPILGQTPAAPAPKPAAVVYKSKHFTVPEWRTLRVLVDLIIPKDERSGSATQGGVPEYLDEVVAFDKSQGTHPTGRLQTQLKGGIAWLNREARRRHEKPFADCAPAQQAAILDLIAWPEKAAPEHSPYVAFFNRLRDLTVGGFFTSKIGIADLGYTGNVAFDWQGPPKEALKKFGFE